jgi:hypothetical protein
MRSGASHVVARVPAFTAVLGTSPDGSQLAGVTTPPLANSSAPSQVVVVSVGRRPARVVTASLGSPNSIGDLFWLGPDRIAFLPRGAGDVRVYNRSLRVLRRLEGWAATGSAVVGSTAFGLGTGGRLLRTRLPDGPIRVVRRLPSPLLRVIAAV